MKKSFGRVISGSLTDGFLIRLNPEINLEEIKTGKFVSIVGNKYKFFSLVTDLKLEVTNPDILLFPPAPHENLLNNILKKRDIYATAFIKPMVMLNQYNQVSPVKTIPPHFAEVYEVDDSDVALIFGREDDKSKKYFNIGCPIDMTTPVCLNLERLVERSNGIFGKTGTGKTFITRVVLAGLIKNKKAVNLIFDMHSEYGLQARQEGKDRSFVKGLKTLFPDKVAIFSLDPDSTRRRGGMPDVTIQIPYRAIKVSDILSLQHELNLHPTALEAAYLISSKYKQNWLEALLQKGNNAKEFAQEVGAHPESISALYRKLKRIERLPFFTSSYVNNINNTRNSGVTNIAGSTVATRATGVSGTSNVTSFNNININVIDQMMEYISRGINIVVEFGNYTSTFVYLLIANIITRRIHAEYVSRTEKFLGSQKKEDEPQKLLITIEEAHKFLNTIAAKQTIFGTIAREMRKYYVSLLVVDQRPSGIDPEIISQIGTKIIAQLSDEKDLQAILTGVNNASSLRLILASLDSKQQALVLGHAITMPVVIKTRGYDEQFYRDMGSLMQPKDADTIINELF